MRATLRENAISRLVVPENVSQWTIFNRSFVRIAGACKGGLDSFHSFPLFKFSQFTAIQQAIIVTTRLFVYKIT